MTPSATMIAMRLPLLSLLVGDDTHLTLLALRLEHFGTVRRRVRAALAVRALVRGQETAVREPVLADESPAFATSELPPFDPMSHGHSSNSQQSYSLL
jgi:hypothetical protein